MQDTVDPAAAPPRTLVQIIEDARRADYDQLGSERAEPLDLLHALDGLAGPIARSAAPSSSPSRAASATAPQVLTLTARKIQAGPGCAAGGTRRPRRGGRSAQRAAEQPARCVAAAPAPTTPQPRRENGNRTAAARAAAPARRRSPGPGGPPPASHARRRPAPGTGTPVGRPRQDHRHRPAPRAGYPRPGSPPLRRGASHPRNTVRSPGPAGLAWQRCGSEALPEPPAGLQRPRPKTSNSATRRAIACSARFTDTTARQRMALTPAPRSIGSGWRQICR